MSKIKGIRKRWMMNSVGVVLLIAVLAVTAFSAAMGSYYYTTMSTGLEKQEMCIRDRANGAFYHSP